MLNQNNLSDKDLHINIGFEEALEWLGAFLNTRRFSYAAAEKDRLFAVILVRALCSQHKQTETEIRELWAAAETLVGLLDMHENDIFYGLQSRADTNDPMYDSVSRQASDLAAEKYKQEIEKLSKAIDALRKILSIPN